VGTSVRSIKGPSSFRTVGTRTCCMRHCAVTASQ
jgi:hypothetical protein